MKVAQTDRGTEETDPVEERLNFENIRGVSRLASARRIQDWRYANCSRRYSDVFQHRLETSKRPKKNSEGGWRF